jgi:hypothetical protein
VTSIVREWRRLSHRFANIYGRACEATEEAKAAMLQETQRGVPYSPVTVAKFDKAVDLFAEARHLISQLIEVHTKLYPDDQKIFELKAMVEAGVEMTEAYRDRLACQDGSRTPIRHRDRLSN